MKENKYGVFPKTEKELLDYLHEQENKSHDYNSIAESLTNVTVAMFNYFASKHGMTGFQASWAGLNFLGITRGYEHPYAVIDSSKMLYPQYDILADVQKLMDEWKPEIAKVAKEKLEKDDGFTHPNVKAHWTELAKCADLITK